MTEPTCAGTSTGSPTRRSAASGDADDLLRRVAHGDMRAFEALYDLAAARVLGISRAVLHDTARAEEVAQQVWAGVWRFADRGAAREIPASTWLMMRAHQAAVCRSRADREAPEVRSGTGRGDQSAGSVGAEPDWRSVRRGLSSLTGMQRQIVTMAYFDGSTSEQISAALEVPAHPVLRGLRDGLIRLRDNWEVRA